MRLRGLIIIQALLSESIFPWQFDFNAYLLILFLKISENSDIYEGRGMSIKVIRVIFQWPVNLSYTILPPPPILSIFHKDS